MSVLAIIAALVIEQWRPLGERKTVHGALAGPAERLLAGFEDDLERTAQMCGALAKLELLESFSVQVKDAPQMQLVGMVRVAEPKLRALAPARVKALLDKGFMGLIYAHLHSLENFSRLVARWNQRKAAGRN